MEETIATVGSASAGLSGFPHTDLTTLLPRSNVLVTSRLTYTTLLLVRYVARLQR